MRNGILKICICLQKDKERLIRVIPPQDDLLGHYSRITPKIRSSYITNFEAQNQLMILTVTLIIIIFTKLILVRGISSIYLPISQMIDEPNKQMNKEAIRIIF